MARRDEAARAFPTSKRERWTEARARAVLDAWERSGLTLAAFARQRGLGPQRLAWWRKRLAETSHGTSPSPVSLVPVTLRPAPAIALGAPVAITARDGVRIEVRDVGAVTAAWVAALLVALDGAGP
ncbi:MAG TPA: hypothetical protein VFS43_41015 [Polyangiaceae bacterium]|nr:hypothetical protein [Polyangiaceae bacterium]